MLENSREQVMVDTNYVPSDLSAFPVVSSETVNIQVSSMFYSGTPLLILMQNFLPTDIYCITRYILSMLIYIFLNCKQ